MTNDQRMSPVKMAMFAWFIIVFCQT